MSLVARVCGLLYSTMSYGIIALPYSKYSKAILVRKHSLAEKMFWLRFVHGNKQSQINK